MRTFSPKLALAIAVSVVLIGQASTATAEVIERVIAVVDDRPIFLSEVRRRALPFMRQAFSAPTETQQRQAMESIYRQILDQMIDEMLIEQLAREMQVMISDADVERAITNVREQNALSEEQFWEAVEQQGMQRDQYRSDVRKQLLRLKVLNQRLRGRVRITEDDVRNRYRRVATEDAQDLRFRVAHIFVELPADASEQQLEEAAAKAEAIRGEVDSESFSAKMAEYGGGELGWLNEDDLSATVVDALTALEEGEVSEVVKGAAGYHVFLLQEKGRTDPPAFEDMREQVYRSLLEETMARQEKLLLEQLRRKSVISNRL